MFLKQCLHDYLTLISCFWINNFLTFLSFRHNQTEITLQMEQAFVTFLYSCMQFIYLLSKCGVLDDLKGKRSNSPQAGSSQKLPVWWLFNVSGLSEKSEMSCWVKCRLGHLHRSVHPLIMSSQEPWLPCPLIFSILIFWFGGLQAAFIENTLTTTLYFHRISVLI